MHHAPAKRCTVRHFSGPVCLCFLIGPWFDYIERSNEDSSAILRQEDCGNINGSIFFLASRGTKFKVFIFIDASQML